MLAEDWHYSRDSNGYCRAKGTYELCHQGQLPAFVTKEKYSKHCHEHTSVPATKSVQNYDGSYYLINLMQTHYTANDMQTLPSYWYLSSDCTHVVMTDDGPNWHEIWFTPEDECERIPAFEKLFGKSPNYQPGSHFQRIDFFL